MDKAEAIRLLGGTHTEVARAIGITPQAVSLWPDELPARIADRVQAALWRRHQAASTTTAAAAQTSVAETPRAAA